MRQSVISRSQNIFVQFNYYTLLTAGNLYYNFLKVKISSLFQHLLTLDGLSKSHIYHFQLVYVSVTVLKNSSIVKYILSRYTGGLVDPKILSQKSLITIRWKENRDYRKSHDTHRK